MITQRQKDCLDFITSEIETKGVAPSFEEMKAHLGLKSKSGVHRIITALEHRGKIVRLENRARAIDIPAENEMQIKDQKIIMKLRQIIRRDRQRHISKAEIIRRLEGICVKALTDD